MSSTGQWARRWYQAYAVVCPRCGASVGKPCIADDLSKMRGVHRGRDLEFNKRRAVDA